MQSSLPQIHLVDINGHDVPTTEKNGVPHDPADAASWPAWTDNWYFEPTDAAEVMAVEAEAFADSIDAPRPGIGEMLWAQMMIEGSLPSIAGGAPESGGNHNNIMVDPIPTPADLRDFDHWLSSVDAPYPPDAELADNDPVYRQVSSVELSMIAAGLPIG